MYRFYYLRQGNLCMIYRTVAAAALLLLLISAAAMADTLTLNDGTVYHGKIISQTRYEVEFEIYRLGGKLKFVKTFDMEEVHSLTRGKIEDEIKKTQPESKPETAPESRPETQPDAKPEEKPEKIPLLKTTAPKTKPQPGPLETPETLAEAIQTPLRHPSEDRDTWDTLTSLQKEDAERKYQKMLEEHKKKNDFRGKAVSWMLTIDDVAKAKEGDGFVLIARSKNDAMVTATVVSAAKDYLLKLKKGDEVRVRGIIEDYDFTTPAGKPGELFPEQKQPQFNIRIRNAGVMLVSDIPQVTLFDRHFESKKTIYLIDSSGSMIDRMNGVRDEVGKSVSKLNASQEFAVVFFKNARNPAAIKMTPATDQNKASSKEQAEQVRPAGQSHVLPYLIMAIKTLVSNKEGGAICLATDGIVDVEEAKSILDAIRKYDPDNRVVINTFLIGEPTEESVEVLKAIAELTGGEYSQVEAAE